MRARSASSPLLAALVWGSSAAAQVCFPPLPPVEPQAGDQFGCSVAMGNTHLAVGANLDDEGAADAGSVTLYDRATRQLVAKLRASDGKVGDQLGFSAAFDGQLLAAGAPLADTDRAPDAGAVYLFEQINGAWRQTAKLTAADGARGDRFGQSISFAPGMLLVGAPNHAARGSLAGAAYVFRRTQQGWQQTQKLVASDAAPFDNFGNSVSFDGTTAVVGASFADPGGVANAGAAYVFRNAGGTLSQTAKLVGERAAQNQFGWAVAVDGATIVVGSPGDDGDAGAVTVFGSTGPPQLLIGPGHLPAARFGAALSLDGARLLVGAPTQGNGAVHVFARSAAGVWTLTDSLPAPVGGGGYGQALSLSDPDLLIGAFEGAGLAQVCTSEPPTEPPRLEVVKTSPVREASPGDRVSYRIVVRNLEDREVTAIRITDEFSPLLRSVTWCRPDDSACTDPQPGDIDHTLSLPAGGRAVLRAFGTLRPNTRLRLLNVACAQSPEMQEPKCGESRIPIVQPPAGDDLSITKTTGATSVFLANPLAYTVNVTNKGVTTVSGARVQDTFPPALVNALWCRDVGSPCVPTLGGPIDDTLTLSAGATATYRIAGLVSPLCVGSLTNTATVQGPAGFVDSHPNDNTATDTTRCVAPPGITAWCMSIDGTFFQGGSITKTFLLINGGPAAQADNPGDEFRDLLPPGLTLVSAAATSGVAKTALNTVSWNGAIPVGGTVTITITATIDAGTAGKTICNQATVSFDADGDTNNESSRLSDDPNTASGPDPCCFQVVDPAAIPTFSSLGLLAFALLTAFLGWARLKTKGT